MYALDANEARKADSTGSMIKEIGKYVGTFTQAEDVTASTGTKGIALSFESDAGQKTRVSLYTQKSNGERIMGFQAVMAIMTCLSLRNITPNPGTIKFWDSEAKEEKTKQDKSSPSCAASPSASCWRRRTTRAKTAASARAWCSKASSKPRPN